MTPEQEKKLNDLEFKINQFIKPDSYFFKDKPIKIGLANSLLGFFGLPPIGQWTSTGETAGMTAPGGTNATNQSTFTGNFGSTAYTISDIVKFLKTRGDIKK